MLKNPHNAVNIPQYGTDLSGIYRGIVENNLDPQKLARVKVRVPMIHGVEGGSNYLDMDKLPWATPVTPTGSGYDHGSCIVPEVGDIVFVMFEDKDRNYPLYLGGCYGKGGTDKTYGSKDDKSTYAGGIWEMPEGALETPKEVYNSKGSPTGKIIYKSPKGATIMVEEVDGSESIRIIDALGQSIRMASSITESSNTNNNARRGNIDSYNGSTGRADELSRNGYSEIAITDAKGQKIQLLSSKVDSSVIIASGESGSGAKITLDSNGAELEFEGNEIQLFKEAATIQVNGHTISFQSDGNLEISGSAKIRIDPDGAVNIESAENMNIKAKNVELEAEDKCIIIGELINYAN